MPRKPTHEGLEKGGNKPAGGALRKGDERSELSGVLFSRMFGKSPIPTAVTQISEGRIKLANDAFARLTGRGRKEIIGHTTVELNLWGDPEDRTRIGRILQKEGSFQNIEIPVHSSSKGIRTCLYSGQLIDFKGEAHILSYAIDITERKKAETAMRESEENFRALAENAGEGISILAKDGSHVYANKKAAEITGYTVEELLKVRVPDLIYPGERHKVMETFRKRIKGEPVPNRHETAIINKDGKRVPVEVSGARTMWHGEPADIVFSRDITERKQAEAELREYQRDLEDLFAVVASKNNELESFVYNVSHELKTPIISVAGFVGALREDFGNDLPEKCKEYFSHITHAVREMESFINHLLEISRIGSLIENEEAIPFGGIVERAIAALKPQIKEGGIVVTVQKDLPVICADKIRLGQVIGHLLANAVKYIGRDNPSPQIHVGTEEKFGHRSFFVRDNGIGIGLDLAENIFGIFHRLHRRKKYSDTGIGLAVCKKIVESHGGRIWLESEPGKGSAFYFTIPEKDGNNNPMKKNGESS